MIGIHLFYMSSLLFTAVNVLEKVTLASAYRALSFCEKICQGNLLSIQYI